jgi:hypothetical protein
MEAMNSEPDQSPRTDEDRTARRRRLVGGLTLSLLATWLLLLAPLPFSILSGLTALIGLVLLIVLIVRSVAERRWGMAVFAALLGVPATLMIMGTAVLSLVFYTPMAELQECLAAALTEQARAQCNAEAQGSMAQWINDLVGG